MELDQEFEVWVREQHLKECASCQKEGKGKLVDTNAVAVMLFKAFYKQYKK